MKLLLPFAALSMAVSAGASIAGTYSGNWPVTVTRSQYANGTYCVTLTNDGSIGWPHSGEALLVSKTTGTLYGTFQLIAHLLTVTIEDPGESGQNAGLVFVAHAANGNIGKGIYDEVYGGEEFDSGEGAFGTKGGR